MHHQSTILIVDDEPSIRNLLANLLGRQNYNLEFAENGLEALEIAQRCHPDVILLDVLMPKMDGYEVCKRIRALPELEDIAIIFITAYNDHDARNRALEVGADDFISKPFDRSELRARIHTTTQLNRSRRLMIERTKFVRMVEFAPNGIMVLHPDGTILLCNPAMRQMLGIADLQQIMHRSIYEFIQTNDIETMRTCLQSIHHYGEDSVRFELMLQQPNQKNIPVEIDAGYFVWDVSPAIQIMARDISERYEIEARARQQIERLAALRTIDTTITSSLDLTITLRVILDQVIELLSIDTAVIWLRQPYTQILEHSLTRGYHRDLHVNSYLHFGEGAAGIVALERRLITWPNDQESIPSILPNPQAPNLYSYIGLPLVVKGQVEGVIELYHTKAIQADAEWLHFLHTLAGQAAIAIDHASLLHTLQHTNVELMRSYDITLEGWARALELRDKETEGHSQRVTEMTVRLARYMGMHEFDIMHIRRGALLHDIGKMGIPDSILLKAGPLNDEEWEIMRQHPVFAYELLAPVSYLHRALDIPYCHHERWDGTGYPRGLKGEQIPLAARIFAVVDTWDALRYDRPYREAWQEEQVQEYIRDLAGTHFDPHVVSMFLQLNSAPQNPETRIKILVVDDDLQILDVFYRTLSDEYAVFITNSAEHALELIMHEDIAVSLVDQRLPGMSGIQLLENVKQLRPNMLSILCSAYFDNAALSQALNLGTVRGFISKPVQLNELRHRVNEVIRQYYTPTHLVKEFSGSIYEERYVR